MRLLIPPIFPSAGLLSLRIAVGVTLLLHGLDQLGGLLIGGLATRLAAAASSVDMGRGSRSLRLHIPAAHTRVTT